MRTTAEIDETTQARTKAEVPPAATIDFTERADPAELPEWMDEACSYEQFRDCLRELDRVNRWTFGFRPTLGFLKRISARKYPQRLRVLEVGFGSGTGLQKFGLWATRYGLPVRLTGIDLNPMAARVAKELTYAMPAERWNGPATWLTGDAMRERAAQGQDVIFSTLVTHHMRDAEIVAFLRWMEDSAAVGWFVNDVLRSGKSYRFFVLLSRLMRWNPFIRNDGPVSIRRGFREADWRRLLAAAGIPESVVRIHQPVPGRLCLTRIH